MDINGITQAMTAGYDNTKHAKEAEKKNAVTETLSAETAAAEYEKSEVSEKKPTAKYDAATIYLENGRALMAKQKYPEFVKKYLKYNQRNS